MTCSRCKAQMADGAIICPKCRSIKGTPSCSLVLLIIFLVIFGNNILRSNSRITQNMHAVGSRGKDIFVAITAANVEREPLGLGNVWPKTVIPRGTDTAVKEISNTPYNNSSDYFYDLYDGDNVGLPGHNPYVRGFDYSKLAGAGIPAKAGPGKLEAKNNMWIIAANITEADDPRIPVLISRNVDVKEFERIVNKGLKKSEFRKRVTFNKKFDEPFKEEGYVMIGKDGRMIFSRGWFKKNIGDLFDHKELPPRDPSKPPIVYLMP